MSEKENKWKNIFGKDESVHYDESDGHYHDESSSEGFIRDITKMQSPEQWPDPPPESEDEDNE